MLDACRAAAGHFKTIGCAVEEVTPRLILKIVARLIDLRSFMVAGANAALYPRPPAAPCSNPKPLGDERGLALSAMAELDAAKVRGTRPPSV